MELLEVSYSICQPVKYMWWLEYHGGREIAKECRCKSGGSLTTSKPFVSALGMPSSMLTLCEEVTLFKPFCFEVVSFS